LLIDIDGVLVQGDIVIPKVLDGIKKLTSNGEFIVPTVFVTNSGNQLTRKKAQWLSKLLEIEVPPKHMVCSHDPLRAFDKCHGKNVLVTGQGNVKEVAECIGFKRVTTVEDVLKVFPMLDAIDTSRRDSRRIPVDAEFSPIETVVLLGEPVRWETNLQLLLDILLTNGDPRNVRSDYPDPHIPVMACNMDLQWRFTAEIPRFGHGVFLLCLESAYRKISGRDLQYVVMVGKPSVVTYKYALSLIMEQARRLEAHRDIRTLYMIGDNINTDILGANLFDDHLTKGEMDVHYDPSSDPASLVRRCHSVLVNTGVSTEELLDVQIAHVHRDFLHYDRQHRQPTHVVHDFYDAIQLIFKKEKFE
jgi:HAD superfamily hydrolase (TIGR01456 family)